MENGASDRERSLIEAAWHQFEDLAERSRSGVRSKSSGSRPSQSTTSPSGSFSEKSAKADPRRVESHFPGYRVLEEIYRGGQGIVLLAEQESTGRRVAIKALRHGVMSGDAERARFEREIELLMRLRHPNIVGICDRGRSDDGAFFVMDYVVGESLDEYLNDPRFTPKQIAEVFKKVAEAVSAAHLHGVVHRDLKPSNIRVDDRGEPRVLDFGLARLLSERGPRRELTETGQFVGSLPWASPEQVQGDSTSIDLRTDVYSLGVMLYQALTGTYPYHVSGPAGAVIQHIISTEPKPPRRVRPKLDDEIETITLKCLAKDPERRYQSAGELARDLERYVRGEAIEAKRESTWYVLRKIGQRHRLAVVLGIVALAAVIVGSAVSLVLYADAQRARTLADSRYQQSKIRSEQLKLSLQFLQDILMGVHPYVAAGADTRLLERILEDARVAARDEHSEPLVRATIHTMLGNSLFALQRREAAQSELDEGLRLRREHSKDDPEPIAESLGQLAVLAQSRGELTKALDHCREIEALMKSHPTLSRRHRALQRYVESLIASGRGEYARAIEYAQEACDLQREALPETDPAVQRSVHDLANALKGAGKFDEARALLTELLERQTALYGPDHPRLVDTLKTMGELDFDQRRFEPARTSLERALVISRATFPAAHLSTAAVLTSLSALSTSEGKYAQGLAHAKEAMEMRQELVGKDSPMNASAVLSVGTALKNLGKLDEAEPYYNEALRLTSVEGSKRIRATALNNLAALYKKRSNWADSARLDREALALRRQMFPGNHPDVAQSLNNLAVSVAALGHKAEAEQLYRECLAMQIALQGERDPIVAKTAVNLTDGVLLRDPNDIESMKLMERSVAVLEEASLPEPGWLMHARYLLAGCYLTHDRPAEAEQLLKACDLMIVPGKPSRISRASILTRLIEACEKQGKTDEADRWRQEKLAPK